jgi:hypothetical protein
MFAKHSKTKDGLQTICIECKKQYMLDWNKKFYSENCKEQQERSRNFRKTNSDEIAKYMRQYRQDKAVEIKAKNKQWVEANRGSKNSQNAKRKAQKLQACPKWLSKAQLAEIKDMYKQAKELEAIFFNHKFHVDHIVPLQGKEVCGLHVPWNLQILTAEENIAKNNKFGI